MQIIEFDGRYSESVKDILVELQEYIVSIDDWKLNIMTPKYREDYFKKTIEECSKEGSKIFLAVENDEVLGFIFGKLAENEKYDDCFYACPKSGIVEELIVKNNVRAKGIGSALLETLEQYFKSIGCKYCYIDVFEPNVKALNFYEKHNYTTRMRTMGKKI